MPTEKSSISVGMLDTVSPAIFINNHLHPINNVSCVQPEN